MDSRIAEDTMLPLDLNGSSNIYKLSDISGDEGHLPSAVGDIAKDRLSVLRARTMKDFEKQITELKKENFNLKLRIYFLEEQIQQKFDGAIEDIYKNNIELKVELESLKHELQEKQNLLIKAFKAVESLAGDKDSKIHSIKEDAQKQLQQMEDFLSSKIHALEEDLKISQAKVESLSNLLEERAQAIDIGHSAISEIYQKDLEVNSVLEEKDRMIKQLNFALETKESLINQLEEEKAQSKLCTGSCAEGKLRKSVDGLQEKDEELKMLNENQKQLADPEASLSQVFEELEKAKVMVLSLQERLEEADQTNYDLKNCVLEKEEKLAVEQKNGLKRDKTIQGLTLALKSKEKETEELNQQIEELNLSLSQAREVVHKVQILKFKGVEYYKNLLMEKETLLADLHIDNMAKDTEIHKLSAVMKKRDQELSDLQQEKERLEKELDEVQQQKSRSDKRINDRKQSEYDELICTLRKEQQIYFTLIESVKDSDSINSLQIELNKICSLRKQLEEDVLANRNLRKMLETQIKATRNKEGDTFSFCGDQTSYMSICLRDHSQINEETEKQSLQELQKKINNKSRLPIPIKSYRSFIKQSMSTDLQHQRAEEELQVYKVQNKEFQEKLDLSELVIKNLKDKLHMSESVAANLNDKLHETESVTENLNEKLYMAESTIESLKDISSTNSMLLKGSGIDTQFGNCNNVHCVKELDGQNAKNVLDNPDELKQRIKDMEIQLEKYQNVLFLLQAYSKQVPANDSFNAVLTTLKTSLEDILDTNMKENTDDRVPETSLYSSNATEVKRELSNQQRMQLKSELQKEKATSLKLLDHVYILQKKIKIMSPSRHKNDIQKMDKTTDHPQEHYRNESLPLSACPSLSDFETSEKSSIESLEDNLNTLKREHEGVMHLPQNLSQDKQNEKLRESLSQANFLVESIRSEYECIKKENEKLQQQLCERDEEIRCLTQDIHKNCNELKRLYEEKQVHQSLQIEQNLCKKLTEVDRRKKDPVTDAEDKNDQNGYLFDAPDNDDGASQCSSRSTVSMSYAPARLVPGHHMWADKNGSHVLGLIEDYDALRKQISEGQKLSGDQGSLSSFSTSVIRVQQILEEANRLLKLLWRVSLPSSTSCFSQDEDLKSEIARLRRKLSECERKLHSTVKHLHSTRQLKEDMEKIIIEQLALTHNVLKKARGNLEIQPVEVQQ